MTSPLFYVCARHPTVHVEMHLPAAVVCVKCGRKLKPSPHAQAALFAADLEPVAHGRT